jgi:hypothetical protein
MAGTRIFCIYCGSEMNFLESWCNEVTTSYFCECGVIANANFILNYKLVFSLPKDIKEIIK